MVPLGIHLSTSGIVSRNGILQRISVNNFYQMPLLYHIPPPRRQSSSLSLWRLSMVVKPGTEHREGPLATRPAAFFRLAWRPAITFLFFFLSQELLAVRRLGLLPPLTYSFNEKGTGKCLSSWKQSPGVCRRVPNNVEGGQQVVNSTTSREAPSGDCLLCDRLMLKDFSVYEAPSLEPLEPQSLNI